MDVYYHYTTARSLAAQLRQSAKCTLFLKISQIMLQYFGDYFGPLAHLVERTHGMGEVAGSSPAWSTRFVARAADRNRGVV